jgi:hypothetical protein
MSDDHSEHLLLVIAGMIFIVGFVFAVVSVSQDRGSDSIIGMAVAATSGKTGGINPQSGSGITPISCIENNALDIPPNGRVKGSITFNYVNNTNGQNASVTRWDTCSGLSSTGSGKVAEYFCKTGTIPAVSMIPCGPGETCEDGACTGGLDCTDTDGGEIYLVFGQIHGWDSFAHQYKTYDDICVDNDQIIENYCVYTGEIESNTVVCQNGCSEGVCIDVAQGGSAGSCTDTDGGINAAVKGSIQGPNNQYGVSLWNFTDMCTMVNMGNDVMIHIAVEGYCNTEGEAYTTWVECPNGCTDGSCNAVQGATGCTDTDGGKIYSVYGTVSGTHYGVNGWTHPDSCLTTNDGKEYVQEGYCENGQALYENVYCPDGCLGGKCINSTPVPCIDSDGGMNFAVYGVTSNASWSQNDSCFVAYNGQVILEERLCDGNNIVEVTTQCMNGCVGGACVDNTTPPTGGCIDSDGGVNYYLKGTTSIYNNGVFNYSFTETCDWFGSLIESYCSVGNDSIASTSVNCSLLGNYVCSNGACIGGNGSNTSGGSGVGDGVVSCSSDSDCADYAKYCDSGKSVYCKITANGNNCACKSNSGATTGNNNVYAPVGGGTGSGVTSIVITGTGSGSGTMNQASGNSCYALGCSASGINYGASSCNYCTAGSCVCNNPAETCHCVFGSGPGGSSQNAPVSGGTGSGVTQDASIPNCKNGDAPCSVSGDYCGNGKYCQRINGEYCCSSSVNPNNQNTLLLPSGGGTVGTSGSTPTMNKAATGNTISNCTDTDGGTNVYVRGTTRGYMNSGAFMNQTDFCMNATLIDGYCQNSIAYNVSYPCTFGCSAGTCNPEPPVPNCTDTDGGVNIYVKGTATGVYVVNNTFMNITDYCVSSTNLMEAYCGPYGPQAEDTLCGTGYYCQSGKCIYNTSNVSCTDSDGGVNLYVNGTAWGYNQNGQYMVYNDVCITGTLLNEAYCSTTYGPVTGNYSCGSGYYCQGAKCVYNGTNTSKTTEKAAMSGVTGAVVGTGTQSSVDFNSLQNAGVQSLSVAGVEYYSKASVPIGIGKPTHYCDGFASKYAFCSTCSGSSGTCMCLGTPFAFSCS